MKELGIYVHIPFCKKKCDYCDFTSFCYDEPKIREYFEALKKEIENFEANDSFFENYKVTTIYFGGGTPSFPSSKYIVEVMDLLKGKFKIDLENIEATIEVNPGTVSSEKLIEYRLCGFNRISIGLQSANDRLLELIGRIHTYDEFIQAYNLAMNSGFENINVDIMLALPTQSEEDLLYTVQKVIDLNPNHVSLYSLSLEKGTKLYEDVQADKITLLDEAVERSMYWDTKKLLEINGYNHYEISNYSKIGMESKHNLNCWNQEDYLGFGVAAYSYFKEKRYHNTHILEDYIELIGVNNFKDISITDEVQWNKFDIAKEYMMIGLRKIEGVKISDFQRKFNLNPLYYFKKEIDKLENFGLLEYDENFIRLTKKGIDLANIVFKEFV